MASREEQRRTKAPNTSTQKRRTAMPMFVGAKTYDAMQERTKAAGNNKMEEKRKKQALGWTEEMAERTMADNANSFKRIMNSSANAVGASRSAASSSVTKARRNKQIQSEARKTSGANAAAKSAAAPFKKTSVEPRRVGGRPNYVEKQTVNRNALNGSASDSARKSIEAAFRKKR